MSTNLRSPDLGWICYALRPLVGLGKASQPATCRPSAAWCGTQILSLVECQEQVYWQEVEEKMPFLMATAVFQRIDVTEELIFEVF